MLRMLGILFGVGFIFAGVAGLSPTFMQDGLLFGYLEVNFIQNIVHIATGVLAIMAATTRKLTVLFFKLLGIVYALVVIASFVLKGDLGFIMMHFNMADNILHLVIAILALYLGFSANKKSV